MLSCLNNVTFVTYFNKLSKSLPRCVAAKFAIYVICHNVAVKLCKSLPRWVVARCVTVVVGIWLTFDVAGTIKLNIQQI